MAVSDTNEVLAEAVDVAFGASGGSGNIGNALSVARSGAGAGLRLGRTYDAELKVRGTVTGTSPTLQAYIKAFDSDGNSFFIGVFPQLGTTPHPNADIASGASSVHAKFQVPYLTPAGLEVTSVRGYGTTGGTVTPTYNDVDIILRPDSANPRS